MDRTRVKQHDIFYFIHIPKTAGTSFYSMLAQLIFPDHTLIVDDHSYRKIYSQYYPDEFSRYKFFRQHANYNFSGFLPRSPIYLTFLRHPISRIVSLYNHLMTTPDRVQIQNLQQLEDKSLIGYLKNMKKQGKNNLQAKFLVGRHPKYHNLTDADYLEIAKMRLNEIAFTGIQEHYARSMDLLAYTFQWDQIQVYNMNKSTKKVSVPSLSAEERSIIEEDNALDIELYNYALADFLRKVDSIHNELV